MKLNRRSEDRFLGILSLLVLLIWTGCAARPPLRGPTETAPEPQAPPPVTPQSHLEGTWENLGQGHPPRQMIFGADGSVIFHGGMEFFGPGRWELDPDRQELILTLDQAPDEKLQIFQMDVGDGVKAFDPARKRITYHFDTQTWALDIAGWPYSKEDKLAPAPAEAEPVLQ